MKNFILLICLLFTQTAIAENVWFTGTVKSLYPTADGKIVVMLNEDSPQCTHPGNPKYHYIEVGQNSVTSEALTHMYSALLTAGTSKKTVSINFDKDSSACYINRLKINF